MRKKTAVLATAFTSIALCTSLIAGTTYALFTSNSEMNIAVTSAKVNVVANIIDDSIQTKSLGNEYAAGTTHTYGSVSVNGGSITVENFTPGDGVKLEIGVTNNSTIAIKYRTVISCADAGLKEALTYKIGDENGAETPWTYLEAKVAIENIHVALELPEDTDNAYQGVSCNFAISVEAVQGNAQTTTLPSGIDASEFEAHSAVAYANGAWYAKTADAIAQGGDVYLAPNSTTNLTNAHTKIPASGITIYANGATFNQDLSIDTYAPAIYSEGDEVNITVYDANNLYLWGQRNSAAVVNIKMVNCSNAGNYDDEIANVLQGGRMVYLTGVSGTTNIVLENCSVTASDSPVYSNANGNIELKGCTFTKCAAPVNINYKATSGAQNVVVDGCTFVECGSAREHTFADGSLGDYAAPIRVTHSKAGGTHTVTVKNTSVSGTKGTNGDVLITIHKGGTQPVTATIENNLTDLAVDYGMPKHAVVAAGASKVIETAPAYDLAISTAEELAAFAADVNNGNDYSGKTVLLADDIDLAGINWKPIGGVNDTYFKGTFNGLGHTISNLTIASGKYTHAVGFFGWINNATVKNFTIDTVTMTDIVVTTDGVGAVAGKLFNTALIDGVTVKNATVSANRRVGGISGFTYGNVTNCSVYNSTISTQLEYIEAKGIYDNGDKVGGICGYVGESSYNISGNYAENVTLSGYREVGGIVGHANSPIYNNTVSNITMSYVELPAGASYDSNTPNRNMNTFAGNLSTVDASNTVA